TPTPYMLPTTDEQLLCERLHAVLATHPGLPAPVHGSTLIAQSPRMAGSPEQAAVRAELSAMAGVPTSLSLTAAASTASTAAAAAAAAAVATTAAAALTLPLPPLPDADTVPAFGAPHGVQPFTSAWPGAGDAEIMIQAHRVTMAAPDPPFLAEPLAEAGVDALAELQAHAPAAAPTGSPAMATAAAASCAESRARRSVRLPTDTDLRGIDPDRPLRLRVVHAEYM
ncbi:MAG: hypothetical protein ACK4YT_13760, partial [Sphingomonas sp.]